jgi:glycosyltransferase involved in cell wall biosynthesis
MSATLVTIAVPTYRRPQLLRGALESVALQRHSLLEVIVADNASQMDEVRQVVDSFRDRIPGLRLHQHATNVGAVNNFFWCLEQARGDYFMWLADDDALAPGTIAALAEQLDREADAVTAVPHWLLKRSADTEVLHPARGYESRSRLARVLRYCWRSTDAFFYAMHRTAVLRAAQRVEYSWPNRGVLSNWAYPYLLDMVLAGRVVSTATDEAKWINNEFGGKTYTTPAIGVVNRLRTVLRRINVHAIYAAKVWRAMGPAAAIASGLVSLASLACEPARLVRGRLRRTST